MCFSAQADVVTGLAVGAVGIDALRHVTDRRELPLASLPLLFAAHQLIEAFVWWGLDGSVPASLGTAAANVYLAIAFVLPIVVPLTVVAVEPDRLRRRIMLACAALGAVISAVMLAALARGDLFVAEAGLHVSYSVGLAHGGFLSSLYIVCVCGAFLASSSRRIVLFGAVNLVAVTTLAWLTMDGVISLWCAWAAVTSILIDAHLRTSHRGDLDPVGVPVPA